MKAAVIGHLGVVGRSSAKMLAKDYDLVTFDPVEAQPYPDREIAACGFAVICVGTPEAGNGAADLEQVDNAIRALPAKLPVLLRSTVPPGTTNRIAGDRKGLVCHAPEFMHERPGGPWRESADVPFMILGGSEDSLKFFRPRVESVFPGKVHECDALTAELAKYTVNLYGAVKVTFVNEMAGIARQFGGNWEQVRAAWLNDPRVDEHYTRMEGFPPGFGGRCWPKDLAALRAACREAGYPAEFLDAVAAANDRFTA